MTERGDEYIVTVMRRTIRQVGEYEKNVEIKTARFLNKKVYNYKIDKSIPYDIADKISASIEEEANRLGFRVNRNV